MANLKSIKFDVLDDEFIEKNFDIQINSSNYYEDSGAYKIGGPIDPRLGVTSKYQICPTCNQKGGACLGHEGHTKLALPVLHPGYRKIFKTFLKYVCLDCNTFNFVAKGIKPVCRQCAKRIHYTFFAPYIIKEVKNNENLLRPIYAIYNSFLKIEPDTYKGLIPVDFKITSFFINTLVIPAMTVRPNIKYEGKLLIDDLTRKLSNILYLNIKLKNYLQTEQIEKSVNEVHYLLNYEIFTYIDNKVSSLPVSTLKGGKPVKSLLERIESKGGLLRSNLRGKRTNNAGRAVISADSTLDVSEIGVPLEMAKKLSRPIQVTSSNINKVRQWITNEGYVKAHYYEHKLPTGQFLKLKVDQKNRQSILEKLQLGDIVYRDLITGDDVVLNRAPTLHKNSIMGHKAVIYENPLYETIRMNHNAVLPYNADFDGDEMNLHAPESQSAQLDVSMFMSVDKNIKDSKNNGCIFEIRKNGLTGAYLLSRNNPTFTRTTAIKLMGAYFRPSTNKKEYSGFELISMCLPEGFNFNQNKIIIEKGIYKEGVLDSSNFSRSSSLMKNLLVYTTDQSYKNHFDAFIHLFSKYYEHLNLSVGIVEYLPDENLKIAKNELNLEYSKKYTENPKELSKITLKYQMALYNLVRQNLKNKKDHLSYCMATAGSSGGLPNLVQMNGAIGQKTVRGKIPHEFFTNELYSNYTDEFEKNKYREGLIWGNYSEGLSFLDFLTDAVGARDAFVSSQLKITNVGYFSRKILCAFSDLCVNKKNHIIDANNNIIQEKFGGSGIDLGEYNAKTEIPVLVKKLKEGFFKPLKDEKLYTLEEIKTYLEEEKYNQVFFEVLKINVQKDQKLGINEVINFCNYLNVPAGSPIGYSAGHSIVEPVSQMTLSSKHKLAGSQTTFERLLDLLERHVTEPKAMIKGSPEVVHQIHDKLKPIHLSNKYKVNYDLYSYLIEIENINEEDFNLVIKQLETTFKQLDFEFLLENNKGTIQLKTDISFMVYQQIIRVLELMLISGSSMVKVIQLMQPGVLFVSGLKGSTKLYKYLNNFKADNIEICLLDPIYVAALYGIEEGRKLLYNELCRFRSEGFALDPRYLSLYCDTTSFTGKLQGLGRSGLVKYKSPLTRVSFEASKSVIFDLAVKKSVDNLVSPISSLMVGQPLQIGSNFYKIRL